jgi:hypothetical protein
MMSCILCCSSRQILCSLQNTSEGSRELDGGEVGVVEVEKRQRAAGNLWHGVRTPDALNRIVGFGGRVGSHVDMRARVIEDARHFVSDARGGVGDEHDAAPLWGLVGLCEQGQRRSRVYMAELGYQAWMSSSVVREKMQRVSRRCVVLDTDALRIAICPLAMGARTAP